MVGDMFMALTLNSIFKKPAIISYKKSASDFNLKRSAVILLSVPDTSPLSNHPPIRSSAHKFLPRLPIS